MPYGADCSEGLWSRAAAPSCLRNAKPRRLQEPAHDPQTLRRPRSKPRPTYTGPTRAAAWSGGAIIGGIIASVIVLGFVLYEVTKIVTHAVNITTSVPRTGEVSRAL